jgi:hypothetical protein
MPISLGGDRPKLPPVVKRQAIGDHFAGAIYWFEPRDVQKKDERTGETHPVLKPNGKPRQELVVSCIAMSGTTASAGLGDQVGVPAPGDEVRLILKGGSFGDWIEQVKALNNDPHVGDVVAFTVDHAQAYDASAAPKGPKITTQAEADKVPRGTPVGFYGPLTVTRATDPRIVALAEAAHARRMNAGQTSLGGGSSHLEDEEPFASVHIATVDGFRNLASVEPWM